jgi:hypothetical protein
MRTITVECWACGHKQEAIPEKDSVPSIMRQFFLGGQPNELTCPKCALPAMEEVE